jgi:hypothetical protein
MWISFNYFVDGDQNLLVWITNCFWWFKIPRPCSYCVFMHVVGFMGIVFGLGFWCVTNKYICLNHQKWYLVLCCVVTRFNFVSIGFYNLYFALERFFGHWMVGYWLSFEFVFIAYSRDLILSEACKHNVDALFVTWKN